MKQRSRTLHAFLIRLIWLSVLPPLLLSVYLAINYLNNLQAQQDREASDRARNTSVALDRDLKARIAALQALADSPLMDDPPRLKDFYKESQGFRKSFSGHVILADLSMQMLFNTRLPYRSVLPKLPRPKGHAAAPEALSTGKPAVGDIFFGPIAKEPLIALVVPVTRSSKTKALLLSIIETQQFQQRLDEIALPDGWSLTLLDGKNEVMAWRWHKDFKFDLTDTRTSKRYFARLSTSHWSVILDIPHRIYRKPIFSATAILSIAILVVTLISIVNGRLSSLRLTRSVKSLTEKPQPGSAYPIIAEIETVRIILNDADMARQNFEDELSKSELLYRNIFESANVGKSITLPTGKLNANKAFCDFLGYKQEELINMTWQELTPHDEIERIQGILGSLLRGENDSARFEKRYIHKNGSSLWADVSVVIQRDQENRPLYFITSIVDITERKLAEQELNFNRDNLETIVKERTRDLRESQIALTNLVEDVNQKSDELRKANERLKELDRLKSMFIASMSHELRTPLNSIIGFSSIILNEWLGPVNAEQKENLFAILRSGKHLLALINDVIDVSKIEAGMIATNFEEFDVYDVITEAVTSFNKELADKGLELNVESVHQVMHTDRRRLLQCVLNLVSNAMKFTERGSVRVSVRLVRRSEFGVRREEINYAKRYATAERRTEHAEPDGNLIEISVEDTGIGIQEKDIPKLFSAFSRIESPLKTKVPGTGLGLYLTKKLVTEVLKGNIYVESRHGEGSRFTIKVPVSVI